MARPREHDLEVLLDHARALWAEHGAAGLTIRALSAASGVSNGAIYNAFGSRDNLLARVWAREADSFLAFQRSEVSRALAGGGPQDGVVAAALAPAAYAETHDEAARLFLAVEAADLMRADLTPAQRAELDRLRAELGGLVVDLAGRLWGRTDRVATTLIKVCVVDLPGKLLLAKGRLTSPLARHALTQAVLGITATDPPDPDPRSVRG